MKKRIITILIILAIFIGSSALMFAQQSWWQVSCCVSVNNSCKYVTKDFNASSAESAIYSARAYWSDFYNVSWDNVSCWIK